MGWVDGRYALQTCRRIEQRRREESKCPPWAGRVGIGFARASLLLTDVKLQEPFETSRFFPTPEAMRCQQHVVFLVDPETVLALALCPFSLFKLNQHPTACRLRRRFDNSALCLCLYALHVLMFVCNLVHGFAFTIALTKSIPPNCANNRNFDNLLDNLIQRLPKANCSSERAHDDSRLLDATSSPETRHRAVSNRVPFRVAVTMIILGETTSFEIVFPCCNRGCCLTRIYEFQYYVLKVSIFKYDSFCHI